MLRHSDQAPVFLPSRTPIYLLKPSRFSRLYQKCVYMHIASVYANLDHFFSFSLMLMLGLCEDFVSAHSSIFFSDLDDTDAPAAAGLPDIEVAFVE